MTDKFVDIDKRMRDNVKVMLALIKLYNIFSKTDDRVKVINSFYIEIERIFDIIIEDFIEDDKITEFINKIRWVEWKYTNKMILLKYLDEII